MMQYYFRDDFERGNCQKFDAVIEYYPDIRFFQPSPDKAPWHVQAILPIEDAETIILNFWPHKAKSQRKPMCAVEGFAAMRALINEAIADAGEEPFDVIEADE